MAEAGAPPVAKKKHHEFTSKHGVSITDDYFWLRDERFEEITQETKDAEQSLARFDPDISAYLKEEDEWCYKFLGPESYAGRLAEKLFVEMKTRLVEDDAQVPVTNGAHSYWWAYLPGEQHRKWHRRRLPDGPIETILDEAHESKKKKYFKAGRMIVSPDGKYLAWSADLSSTEHYTVRVRDLCTGLDLPDILDDVSDTWSDLVWSADSTTMFYNVVNECFRVVLIKAHTLGCAQSEDVTVFEEKRSGFTCNVKRSRSGQYMFIETGDNATREVYTVPLMSPSTRLHSKSAPVLVRACEVDHYYDADEHDGRLYIRTNDVGPNFRVVTAAFGEAAADWREVLPHNEDFHITRIRCFADFLLVVGCERGLSAILTKGYTPGAPARRLLFSEPSYVIKYQEKLNREFKTDRLILVYESMVTPPTTYEFNVSSGELVVLKVQGVPSGYAKEDYITERIEIEARDGTRVPVSVAYRKDFVKDSSGHLYIQGYGSYGRSTLPEFDAQRLTLLNRGFAVALAHIRGGAEMGYAWYLAGKLDRRTNTFNDFVDCTKGLIELGFAQAGHVAALGRSAGGQLMGAIANQAPSLYGVIVATVPFMDVLNTMLDASLPLTPREWSEWGNPSTDSAAFNYIHAYSPYDNVRAQAYPAMLITGGILDPRVTYWEPAKWVARLRATKTDSNVLLLKMMGAGHFGAAGRYNKLHECAIEAAFMLWQLYGEVPL